MNDDGNVLDWVLERLPADTDELDADWPRDPYELEQVLLRMRAIRLIGCCDNRWYTRPDGEAFKRRKKP